MKSILIILLLTFCDANPTPSTPSPASNQTDQPSQSNITHHNLNISTSANSTTIRATPLPRATPDLPPAKTPCPSLPPPPPPPSAPAYKFSLSPETLFAVVAGLVLAGAILLLSTLLLACKACELSRRLETLSGRSDPAVSAKYWNSDKSMEKQDNNETVALMVGDEGGATDEGGVGKEEEEEEEKKGENGGVVEKKESEEKMEGEGETTKEEVKKGEEEEKKEEKKGNDSGDGETGPESGGEKETKDGE